jgi:predicted DNA-binding transcriptional regulator YafY
MEKSKKTDLPSVNIAKAPNKRSSKPRDASRHSIRRYLDMLQIIPRAPKSISTKEIFNRLIEHGYDVSLKTVQRDLMKLMEDDYQLIYDEKGGEYSWYFLPGSKTWVFPGGLEEYTALSVVMADKYLKPVMPYASGFMPSFDSAKNSLLKKAEQNTSRRDNEVSQWLDKVHVMPFEFARSSSDIEPDMKDFLYAAVEHESFVWLSYKKNDVADVVNYFIHPLGLIYRHPIVYLVGLDDGDKSTIRRFAMHRIVDYADSFEGKKIVHVRPAGFNLETYAEEAFGLGRGKYDTLNIKLWVDKNIAKEFEDCPIADGQVLNPVKGGGFHLMATVPNSLELRRFIGSLGAQVKVLEPKELRAEFAAMACDLAKIYAGVK